MKPVYLISLLFSILCAVTAAVSAEGTEGLAVLSETSLSSEGVPGFGPNRIEAIRARYADGTTGTGEGDMPFFTVWAVAEPVILRKGVWHGTQAGGARLFESVVGTNRPLVGSFIDIAPREGSGIRTRWFLVLEFPASSPRDGRLAWARALAEAVSASFQAARRREDLSFPATVVLFTGGKKK